MLSILPRHCDWKAAFYLMTLSSKSKGVQVSVYPAASMAEFKGVKSLLAAS